MSFPYTVKSGDTLTRIAAEHGLPSWRELYQHPDNAEFRRKRPNPDRIFPGDVVIIPSDPAPPSPAPPEPPSPPKPSPPTREATAQALKAYVAAFKTTDVVGTLVDHPRAVIAFGEIHHNNNQAKARLLAAIAHQVKLRRPVNTHFHANEHWTNDQPTRNEINRFVQADPRALPVLSADLQQFRSLLFEANNFPGRRFGALPIQFMAGQGENIRHQALFDSFNTAALVCPDVPFNSIGPGTSRGTFLLGALHAAHQNIHGGAQQTTCGLLDKASWKVLAVRLNVSREGTTGLEAEAETVRMIDGDQSDIDLYAIVKDVAGFKSLFVDLRMPGSPFGLVKRAGGVKTPYNELYDAIVYLS